VKAAAKVCRYCGHEFTHESVVTQDASRVAAKRVATRAVGGFWSRPQIVIAIVVVAAALVGVIGWAMAPRLETPAPKQRVARQRVLPTPVQESMLAGPELATGETLEWSADKDPGEVVRQVGALVVRITRKTDDDMVAPVVTVTRGVDSVTMVGELASSGYTHRLSAVRNIAGAPAVVMLQSFSGGAHCCNHVQLAGPSGGRLKVVDLGSWDGDELPMPADLNGDGVADFVEHDNAFLYAFAAYAMSYAPPTILNVAGGRVVDVSRRPDYRRLYLQEMTKAGETCRTAADGMDRNGACPSYVASAARVGRLEAAWADMMRAYSATENWEYPTGCSESTRVECPEAARIVYKSYPEALLAFLKEHGYVAADWTPPFSDGGQESLEDKTTGAAS
jgi:hypothetical protein